MSTNPDVEEVVIDFSYETESEDGDKTMHAYSIDGRILLITKPNPWKLEQLRKASDETLQFRNRRNPTETGQHLPARWGRGTQEPADAYSGADCDSRVRARSPPQWLRGEGVPRRSPRLAS
jgi:hypothetical protein